MNGGEDEDHDVMINNFVSGGELDLGDQWQNNANNENELRHRHVRNSSPSTSSSSAAREMPPPIISRRQVKPQTWFEWATFLAKLPVIVIYQSVLDLLRYLWSVFRAPPLSVSDPRNDVRQFIEEFRTQYPHSNATFFEGSYDDALNECKNSLRFMIVYLHNPSHQATNRFVEEVLLSTEMQRLINENQIFLWGASVRSQEGYKVSMALRENTYPFLGLLCMRDSRMVLVLRMEGEYELESLIFTIQTAIDENRTYIDMIRNERREREMNNQIRREQETDYERSLAADRARRDEQRRVEHERKMAEELEAEQRRMEQEKIEVDDLDKLAKLLSKFQALRAQIAAQLPPESNSQSSIRVSVRFPSGHRFVRKFDSTHSLEMLFNAIVAQEQCPVNFTLVSSYPRQSLNCAPAWYQEFGSVQDPCNIPTFADCGFEKSVVVLVQDNDA